MAEPKKKVVKAAPAAKAAAADTASTETEKTTKSGGKVWQATPEAKKKALGKRIVAVVLWVVAIALQAFAIFGLLNQPARTSIANRFGWSTGVTQGADGAPVAGFPNWAFWTIIGILAINLVLVLIAGFMWKAANRLDPASREDKVRFFIQNQLGAIIPIIAFLPLIILIFMNKDMDGKQKGWAGGIGIAALAIGVIFGVDLNPPSIEQYTAEQNWDLERVVAITGEDMVYWIETGNVYHLCAEVSPLQNSSAAEILSGTVAQATADTSGGMERLTRQVQMEVNQCNAAGHNFMNPVEARYLEHTPPANFFPDVDTDGGEDAEG